MQLDIVEDPMPTRTKVKLHYISEVSLTLQTNFMMIS